MKISVNNVTKNFGSVRALDHVTFTLEENKIYGLLGDNGAGKSTLLSLITNRRYPSSGTITADGMPVADNDTVLGQMILVGEENFMPEDFSVKKGIRLAAMFYRNFDVEYALDLTKKFHLKDSLKIEKLSTGQGTIFRMILALAANTPVMLLDEPVLGLDASQRDLFYSELLKRVAEKPCTVVISTHIIQEVANMLEHVLILKEGKLVKDMPMEDLLTNAYTVSGPANRVDAYIYGRNPLSVQVLGGLKTACLEGDIPDPIEGLEFAKADLQEYFISLIREEE